MKISNKVTSDNKLYLKYDNNWSSLRTISALFDRFTKVKLVEVTLFLSWTEIQNFPERKWSGNTIGTYLCGSRTSIDKRGSKSLGAEGATWHYTWLPDAWLLPSLSVPAAAVRVPLPRHRCHLKHTTGYHDSFTSIHAPTWAPTYLRIAFPFYTMRIDQVWEQIGRNA